MTYDTLPKTDIAPRMSRAEAETLAAGSFRMLKQPLKKISGSIYSLDDSYRDYLAECPAECGWKLLSKWWLEAWHRRDEAYYKLFEINTEGTIGKEHEDSGDGRLSEVQQTAHNIIQNHLTNQCSKISELADRYQTNGQCEYGNKHHLYRGEWIENKPCTAPASMKQFGTAYCSDHISGTHRCGWKS